ncbi:MAG: Gfo/Idh/MocA family oxidoreductase [Candidatus Hydrogenedentota bacterium]
MNERGMTRRDFGKLGAAATFAAWTGRKAAAQTNSDTLKVGLIGCGGRGTGMATNMLDERNENVQLIALADVFEDRLNSCRNALENNENVAARVNVDDGHCFVGLDAYRQLLETDVDVVMNCCPPYIRPEHLEATVEAGKHIFAEKPIAVDPVGVRRVIAVADKAEEEGLSFLTGTQFRHDSRRIQTIEQIHEGAIGDVVALTTYYCGNLPWARGREEGWSDLEYRLRNWLVLNWVGGSNIVEQAIHGLDVMNWVMDGPPRSVLGSGARSWLPKEEQYGDIWDNFTCNYEYPDGTQMYHLSRWWPTDGQGGERIVGTEGESNTQDMGEPSITSTVQQFIDLTNSIRGEGPYYNEGRRIANSTLTAIMGRMSAYTGKRILWEEAMESDVSLVPDELDFDLEYPLGSIAVPGEA